MAEIERPRQGQIVWTNLNPTKGHEQRGKRPVLIVSNNDFNELCGGMVKVVSITSTMRKFPLHVALPEGLPIHGMIKLEQERSIDISARGWELACEVPKDFMNHVLQIISITY